MYFYADSRYPGGVFDVEVIDKKVWSFMHCVRNMVGSLCLMWMKPDIIRVLPPVIHIPAISEEHVLWVKEPPLICL